MKINLPEKAKKIIDILEKNLFECYAVGGCVRDSLLGLEPSDWDFTTNARPHEIEECFCDFKTLSIGKRYGTIAVIIDGKPYEITTYRYDGEYTDFRHPDKVNFSKNLKDDLSRRDFTVNAMAYNPKEGIVDYFGGEKDLKYKVIRCVGDADNRFKEDALRILRALRFASKYGFSIELQTQKAIFDNKNLINNISAERISVELLQLLCGNYVDVVLRMYKEIVAVIIPELSVTFNFDQRSPHHNRTLYKHIVCAVKNIEADPILRLTMLLHDIGKPITMKIDKNGRGHFYNHPKVGVGISIRIMKRLCLSNTVIDEVSILIFHHDDRLKPDKIMIKHLLNEIGLYEFKRLMKVQYADICAQSNYKRDEKFALHKEVMNLYNSIVENGECFSLDSLEINGKDIISLGVSRGEIIGKILNELLEMVICKQIENDKEQLLYKAKEMINVLE